MVVNDVDNFLAHYGKKGMKWGKRNSSSSTTKESRKTSRGKKIGVSALKAMATTGAFVVPVMVVAAIVSKKNNSLNDLPTNIISRGKSLVDDMFWDIVNRK